MRVGINGLGRIGRLTLRAALGGVPRAEGDPRAAITPADVPAALDRLGIAEVAAQYRRLRETSVMGDQS